MTELNDGRFRKEYSKSLAQALQEREGKQPSKEILLKETYSQLCFDDPQVTNGDHPCRLLGTALLKLDSLYKISDPLIDGIRQATDRTAVSGNVNVAVGAAEEQHDNDDGEQLQWLEGVVASAAGYSLLAFYCFLKIPLECCQSQDFETVKRLLGSYRGPKRPPRDADAQDDDARIQSEEQENDARIQALSNGMHEMEVHGDSSSESPNDNVHEYEEVFAAESDPSDFDYGESVSHQAQALDEQQWSEAAFDPEALSKSPVSTDWNDLRQGVANLLSELSYRKLAPLSKQQWSSLGVSDLLSQLTLTLLLQPENSSPLLLNEDLRQLGVQLLNVLSDAVGMRMGVLGDYLLLLQTLLGVDAAAEPTASKTLAPATVVGLTALSSLCARTSFLQKEAPQDIRNSVLLACEDLSHIVEKTRLSDDDSIVCRLTWTLFPLLDRVTNISPQGIILESSCTLLSNKDAQLLLQTGVFRELILIHTSTATLGEDKDDNVSMQAARTQLLRSIQVMCMESHSLLAKYAWRVPDLAKLVQTEEFAIENAVDGIIWNVFGSSLAGGPVRMRIKDVPVLTASECRARVVDGFERLSESVKASLKKIDGLRTTKISNGGSDDSTWKEPIEELSRFSNYLVSVPSFASLWRDAVASNNDMRQRVTSATSSLRSALSKLSRVPESREEASDATTLKNADNDKAGEPLERPASTYGENEEAAVRKAIKILSASGRPDTGGGSSKTD